MALERAVEAAARGEKVGEAATAVRKTNNAGSFARLLLLLHLYSGGTTSRQAQGVHAQPHAPFRSFQPTPPCYSGATQKRDYPGCRMSNDRGKTDLGSCDSRARAIWKRENEAEVISRSPASFLFAVSLARSGFIAGIPPPVISDTRNYPTEASHSSLAIISHRPRRKIPDHQFPTFSRRKPSPVEVRGGDL